MYRVTIEQQIGCDKHLISQHDYHNAKYAKLDADKLAGQFNRFKTEVILDTPESVKIRVNGDAMECIIIYTLTEVA